MSQPLPPCPLPSAVQCNCLFGLLGSGFVGEDTSTYAGVLNANTTQRYHLTGEWVGLDAITEYLDAYGGDFVSRVTPLQELFFDFSQSTEEECRVLATGPSRVFTVAENSAGGVAQCVDFVGGSTYRYQLTGNPAQPVTMAQWDIWVPDDFIPTVFGAIDTPATAEFVCDVIVNVCDGQEEDRKHRRDTKKGKDDSKQPKKAKESKKKGKKEKKNVDPMTECLERYWALPANHNGFWIDGDSRHCRILHGAYAATNPIHCPHVSFAKEVDANGFFKCFESRGWTALDVFTPEQLAFFQLATLPYASSNPHFAAYPDGNCPVL